MAHKEVLNNFKLYFPQFAESIDVWFPNGKNSIRIRLKDKREFIFTYHNVLFWRFETVDSFLIKRS